MIFLRIRWGGCLTLSHLVGMGIFLAEIQNGKSTISENCVFIAWARKKPKKACHSLTRSCFTFPHVLEKWQDVLLMDHGFIHSFIFIQARRLTQKNLSKFHPSRQFCFLLHSFPVYQSFSWTRIPRNRVLLINQQEDLDTVIVSVDLAHAMIRSL